MLRSMNGKPVVVCNRCLYVRETSMDNMRIVDFKHPRMDDTHDDWRDCCVSARGCCDA